MNEMNDAVALLPNHFESLEIAPSFFLTEGKTAWKDLCFLLSVKKGKSAKYQAEPRGDLIEYCRLWEIEDGSRLLERWVYHPDESVKLQLEKEFKRLKFIWKLDLDSVLECVETLWSASKNLETSKGCEPIRTLNEAEKLFGVFKCATSLETFTEM